MVVYSVREVCTRLRADNVTCALFMNYGCSLEQAHSKVENSVPKVAVILFPSLKVPSHFNKENLNILATFHDKSGLIKNQFKSVSRFYFMVKGKTKNLIFF